MNNILLNPPVAFIILLVASFILAIFLSKLLSSKHADSIGKGKPYACGEDVPVPMVQPDYSQFFQFALFFTIMHVVALILTTVPKESATSLGIAVVYLLGAIIGLLILFRRS